MHGYLGNGTGDQPHGHRFNVPTSLTLNAPEQDRDKHTAQLHVLVEEILGGDAGKELCRRILGNKEVSMPPESRHMPPKHPPPQKKTTTKQARYRRHCRRLRLDRSIIITIIITIIIIVIIIIFTIIIVVVLIMMG
jgi:hypothetical protein